MPMLIILTKSDEPPYERNGKVTPVTGTSPTTTARFKIACKIMPKDKPNTKYFPNKSLVLKNIFIDV